VAAREPRAANTEEDAIVAGTWQFWIDRGGTFTDVVARRPNGSITSAKLLSDHPERYADAAVEAIRNILRLAPEAPVPAETIGAVKMGTTVATNALLERRGEGTVLAITRGFGDALRIGYQNRPHLFARRIELPEQLYTRVIEIDERVDAGGEVLEPLDEAGARQALERAFDAGYRSVAIVLLHAYRFADHERRLAEFAREVGFEQVSSSHEVSPLMKLVGRGDTTVVDAYLSPVLNRYVRAIASALGGVRLMFMQSNGGLTDATRFQGKDAILSGPAGGVIGMVRTAEIAGFDKVIGFDMGGTSTDVTHYDGALERSFETLVAGVRIRAPMLRIHTIAAGGGSILRFDGDRLRVGPASAGADPGPACYRRGGPLTLTDANVLLGRIQADHFPHVFGSCGDEKLDDAVVREKFDALAAEIAEATGMSRASEEVAEGFLTIAVENMANAIKQISVQRGHDVTRYLLNGFGGAAGQHVCRVAETLGIETILIHPHAGVLSAYGMGLADMRSIREESVEAEFSPDSFERIRARLDVLAGHAAQELTDQGVDGGDIAVQRRVHLKYQGTDTAMPIEFDRPAAMHEAFEDAHRARFGFHSPERALIAEAIEVEAVGAAGSFEEPATASADAGVSAAPAGKARLWLRSAPVEVPLFARETLEPGQRIDGPALIVEPNATTVVEPGWRVEITNRNHMLLRHCAPRGRSADLGTTSDPVMLEVFNNLFMAIAEQMGAVLANTAQSVNIKERLDFSCAVFNRHGSLVANAPHLPVHLGSMADSVQAVVRARGSGIRPGQVYVLNAPYNGGTHLPDVTVITPVFDDDQSLLFFVGSRGHHADIGGKTPGSMPPDSRTVEEEGVLLDDLLLVEAGTFREAEIRAVLASGPFPARNIDQNIADLKAQIGANEMGVRELHRTVRTFGLDVVEAYMGHVQANAEEHVRRVIDVLKDGEFTYEMDTGAVVRVAVRIDRAARSAVIDFSGTSPQQPTNFNAPPSVTTAAVLYVFRTLVDDDIPLNSGCLKPLEIRIPAGSLLSPQHPAAVVAGNVETSQVVTDALFGALGVLAASQGTMNNFTFGDATYQYYETICGGAGAGPGFDGADAVHTHMTNTRLTDPEVLEWRYPVLVQSFGVRKGSGGAGRHRGGDGAIRRIVFRRPMHAAILSGHRRIPPFGLMGGSPGAVGRNSLVRKDGTCEQFPGTGATEMRDGDCFVIETPGGGGYGTP
jgi:5-oxoprolinase (ATP-hydrolysing)